ncbi:MAG: bifunctional [glutamine synthetase] adenylyltransferase/[glutamine synthetase]-adenylyl-L-tyrosine phosphorylase [Beijerinckiaceae bacterium]
MSHSLINRLRVTAQLPDGAIPDALWREKILDYADDVTQPQIQSVLQDAQATMLVAAICAHSPFLTGILRRHMAWIPEIFGSDPDAIHAQLLLDMRAFHNRDIAEADLMRVLRIGREKNALLVALADIGGVWDVNRVTAALADFADAAVNAAVDYLLFEARQSGKLLCAPHDDLQSSSGLVILAMGKHGARELNYSSDIDLIVFYDVASANLSEDVEPSTFYVRLTKGLVKLLQNRTEDGYVARVDLRLRPDPGSSATAVSLPTAYNYYESVGQNWERAAFIKARAIAGNLTLGNDFLKALTPFIWRKYFDFAAIADIHAMKRQIQTARGHGEIAVAGHDIKLGRGGIREIEFFVQTQQLVFGGRKPRLRGRRTVDMLGALVEEEWISADARDELSACYYFLRTVEHRLQMRMDEQTQRLPQEEHDLLAFSQFAGFATLTAFSDHLTQIAMTVQKHYARLFEEADTLASDVGSLVFTGTSDDPETVETLQSMGFKDPPLIIETIRGWHFGRRAAVTSARAREVLTELVPLLLKAFGKTADPDGAITAFDRALVSMPGAVELFSILRSNQKLLALFADILGTAPRLAEVVSTHPHVLDTVIDPYFVSGKAEAAVIEARLRHSIGQWADFEECLDRMRDCGRQEIFMIGARLLSDLFSPAEAGVAYTAIAESLVRIALNAVKETFEKEHGQIAGGKIAVLALGKLGGHELTPSSDLDLVVVYDFDEKYPESSGPRKLHAVQYYTRLTQRLITALTAQTRSGFLYEVDLRLRPSGSKGPLASQFKGWIDYQNNEAEVWEHMALTRSRPIAGDADFFDIITSEIQKIVRKSRDPQFLAREVVSMRTLIAQSKGDDNPDDLKLVAGGLLDCEFIAQFLALKFGRNYAPLISGNTASVLHNARKNGLVSADDADYLCESYAFMRDVQQWQRLTVRGDFNSETAGDAVLRRISAALGVPDYRILQSHLREIHPRIRRIFNELLTA